MTLRPALSMLPSLRPLMFVAQATKPDSDVFSSLDENTSLSDLVACATNINGGQEGSIDSADRRVVKVTHDKTVKETEQWRRFVSELGISVHDGRAGVGVSSLSD